MADSAGPLRRAGFRLLWLGSVSANTGTWMQNIGAAWLMTELTGSALLVALVQSATTLPTFLVALPAGVIADIVDRRRLLIAIEVWVVVVAATLAVATAAGLVGPAVLLGFTFLIGMGLASFLPTWQSSVPELVPPEELPAAMALGGIAINAARAVGPAIGGLIIAVRGPEAVFALNAVMWVLALVAMARWRRQPVARKSPPERVLPAAAAALRYAHHSPDLRAVMARSAAFVAFAGALWALLPQVARHGLGLGAGGYGILFAFMGGGAVAAGFGIAKARTRLSSDRLLILAALGYAGATLVLAQVHDPVFVALGLALGGAAWTTQMAMTNTAAQRAVPEWVRGRATALYTLVFQGGLAISSALWGVVALALGSPATLSIAAAGLVIVPLAGLRWPLAPVEEADRGSADLWPRPRMTGAAAVPAGPVRVSVRYHVPPVDTAAFIARMGELRQVRLRDGASDWALERDLADADDFVESFHVRSWQEHLRQHERLTRADLSLEREVRELGASGGQPPVEHLVEVDRRPGAVGSAVLNGTVG
jgi:MFS family permease